MFRTTSFNKVKYLVRTYCRTYTKNEEWIDKINKSYNIGITNSAIQQLGELVYLEYQMDINTKIKKDEEIVVFESVKATDSINAPFDCILEKNNLELEENLKSLNNDSENTWIIKIKKDD
jgi:glycine cleavage system H protein